MSLSSQITALLIDLAEQGCIPEPLLRAGIRKLCQNRLDSLTTGNPDSDRESLQQYVDSLRSGPIAFAEKEANLQHYEVPARFFDLTLGKRKKYSSCFFQPGDSLDQAEERALAQTVERAEIQDGMKILELGCGWGSLTLYLAEKFPNSRITAISNSHGQREFIEARLREKGWSHVQILTRNIADANLESPGTDFDRVVSVEMFEHMRNYQKLLARVAQCLRPGGKLFVHIFTHTRFAYPFETEGEDNWMGKYFFTGGQMPSHELLYHFQDDLKLERDWIWNGTHYSKTSEEWLRNLESSRAEVLEIFKKTYDSEEASRWYQRWRIFFLSCAELFGFAEGKQWVVSHYRFVKP